jgi:hypothetical protein
MNDLLPSMIEHEVDSLAGALLSTDEGDNADDADELAVGIQQLISGLGMLARERKRRLTKGAATSNLRRFLRRSVHLVRKAIRLAPEIRTFCQTMPQRSGVAEVLAAADQIEEVASNELQQTSEILSRLEAIRPPTIDPTLLTSLEKAPAEDFIRLNPGQPRD